MAICNNDKCKKIIFNGFKDKDFIFCNEICHKEGYSIVVFNQISKKEVNDRTRVIHNGICPKCKRKKIVDVHTSYRIISFLISNKWTISNICCSNCGKKAQVADLVTSLFLGWFGHLGIIYTPAYVFANLVELFRNVDPSKPSIKLENLVRDEIASQLYNEKEVPKLTPKSIVIRGVTSENSSIKSNIFKIFLFFKFSHLWLRFTFFIILFAVIYFSAIPDLFFYIEKGKPVELTLNELKLMPKDKIPNYVKIKDGVVNGNYLVEHREKNDKGKLEHITYPVFSTLTSTNQESFLLVNDSNVNEDELKQGKYFSQKTFKIEGKINDISSEYESKEILEKAGYKISERAILLENGNTPIPIFYCIIIILVFTPICFFILISLLPISIFTRLLSIKN